MWVLFVLLCSLFIVPLRSQPCVIKSYGTDGTVCVCNSTYCDTVPKPEKIKETRFLVYTSNKNGLRFHQNIGTFSPPNTHERAIHVDRLKQYQTIFGFGGAFTDAAGVNIKSLPKNMQDMLLKSYFSEEGIEYSLCRVPIGGTDFSERIYTYDDGREDPNLVNFTLAPEDFQLKIPFIQRAINLTKNNVRFIASAWTAPKWMKANRDYSGFGFIRENMYQAWVDYFIKFLNEYKSHGIKFWGLTTGNEPNDPWVDFSPLEVVNWPAWKIGNWIENNLGPTIRKSDHSGIKILILDDQRAYLPWYMERALGKNSTRSFIDGVAVHWYQNHNFSPDQLVKTHNLFPEMFILQTEASNEPLEKNNAVALGSWERGEKYSADIIENMLHWVSGWIDWNMVLNLKGGPSCIGNFVDAPIIVNATSEEFYKQPMFYHLGHFSKFVPPGSVRIDLKIGCKHLDAVAFRRPDNGTAVVILNRNHKKFLVKISDKSRGSAMIEVSEKSINTILYW